MICSVLFVSRSVRNDGWVMTITDYFKYSQRICSEYTTHTIWMPRSHRHRTQLAFACVYIWNDKDKRQSSPKHTDSGIAAFLSNINTMCGCVRACVRVFLYLNALSVCMGARVFIMSLVYVCVCVYTTESRLCTRAKWSNSTSDGNMEYKMLISSKSASIGNAKGNIYV